MRFKRWEKFDLNIKTKATILIREELSKLRALCFSVLG